MDEQNMQVENKIISIAHIVNPVKVKEDNPSYLFIAQPVTFQSMVNAKEYAKDKVNVNLYTTQYPEDREIIHKDFIILPDLEKNINDYVDLRIKSRKLPTIRDILMRAYENCTEEYIIYSNVDIGVKKDFYLFIKENIEQGYDGLCIHRQDLPKSIKDVGILDVNKLDIIYNLKGKYHYGHDCFLMRRENIPKFSLRHVFIGYPPVGMVLKCQIKKFAKKFKEYPSTISMTFHLGSDQVPMKNNLTNKEYREENMRQAKGLYY